MRAAIFIDGGYLIKQLQDARLTPDYTNLAAYLLKPLRRNVQLDLMRCYFYYCPPWMSEKPTETELRRMAAHERFVAELQQQCDRWQVRLGKLERRREGDKEVFAQKRVDVQLSVDLVHHTAAGHIQHAVLVAGDSDFIPAVIAAKESGATLTLWCDRDRSVHRDLMLHADEVHYFDWRQFPARKVPQAERIEKTEVLERLAPTDRPTLIERSAASERPGPIERPAPTERPAPAERLGRADIEPALTTSDEPLAVAADGPGAANALKPKKKRRSRRRGSGRGAASEAQADGSAPSPEIMAEVSANELGVSSGSNMPNNAIVSEEPSESSVVTEQKGEGDEGTAESAPAAKSARRRRGGRGRRRKIVGTPPPVAE
jgi:uncharacterized LabA/DUF88 family protein